METHEHTIFPLTGIYKGLFVQVLAYAWFYKSENIDTYAKSSFCGYVYFWDEIYEEFYKRDPLVRIR